MACCFITTIGSRSLGATSRMAPNTYPSIFMSIRFRAEYEAILVHSSITWP